jgi:hypothetical protein
MRTRNTALEWTKNDYTNYGTIYAGRCWSIYENKQTHNVTFKRLVIHKSNHVAAMCNWLQWHMQCVDQNAHNTTVTWPMWTCLGHKWSANGQVCHCNTTCLEMATTSGYHQSISMNQMCQEVANKSKTKWHTTELNTRICLPINYCCRQSHEIANYVLYHNRLTVQAIVKAY